MYTHRLAIAPLAFSILFLSAALQAGEASTAETEPWLVMESETWETDSVKSPDADQGARTAASRETLDDMDKKTGNASRKTNSGLFDRNKEIMPVRFGYSNCVLQSPVPSKTSSERELYSMLLALTETAAKAAKPFVESPDELDSGARDAATRIMDLNEEERDRIREIMLKGRMDFDSRIGGFADEVAAEFAPARFEGTAGRNFFPFATRHHAAVIVLALEALESSNSEDARELARDLIVDHTDALAEIKELQQEELEE